VKAVLLEDVPQKILKVTTEIVLVRVEHVEHVTPFVCKVPYREVEVRLRKKNESVIQVPFLLHGKKDILRLVLE
jgi:hypothetical protein